MRFLGSVQCSQDYMSSRASCDRFRIQLIAHLKRTRYLRLIFPPRLIPIDAR